MSSAIRMQAAVFVPLAAPATPTLQHRGRLDLHRYGTVDGSSSPWASRSTVREPRDDPWGSGVTAALTDTYSFKLGLLIVHKTIAGDAAGSRASSRFNRLVPASYCGPNHPRRALACSRFLATAQSQAGDELSVVAIARVALPSRQALPFLAHGGGTGGRMSRFRIGFLVLTMAVSGVAVPVGLVLDAGMAAAAPSCSLPPPSGGVITSTVDW